MIVTRAFGLVAFVCSVGFMVSVAHAQPPRPVAVDSTNQHLRISPKPTKSMMINMTNDGLTTKVGHSALMMPKAPAVSLTVSKKTAEASAPPPPTWRHRPKVANTRPPT